MPDLPAGEDLPALVAALRAANARLREVIEAKDAQLAVAEAALVAAEEGFTGAAPGQGFLDVVAAAVVG